MRVFATAVLMGTLCYAPAGAQIVRVIEQERCWLGSLSFSPGATVRAGSQIMVCSSENAWEPTPEAASGCIFDGDFFGVGAVDNGPRQDAQRMFCRNDGVWERIED